MRRVRLVRESYVNQARFVGKEAWLFLTREDEGVGLITIPSEVGAMVVEIKLEDVEDLP